MRPVENKKMKKLADCCIKEPVSQPTTSRGIIAHIDYISPLPLEIKQRIACHLDPISYTQLRSVSRCFNRLPTIEDIYNKLKKQHVSGELYGMFRRLLPEDYFFEYLRSAYMAGKKDNVFSSISLSGSISENSLTAKINGMFSIMQRPDVLSDPTSNSHLHPMQTVDYGTYQDIMAVMIKLRDKLSQTGKNSPYTPMYLGMLGIVDVCEKNVNQRCISLDIIYPNSRKEPPADFKQRVQLNLLQLFNQSDERDRSIIAEIAAKLAVEH